MRISMIAAMSSNRIIGRRNKLPWHIPADLQFFKKMTKGKPVVMGRKTFESFKGALPDRDNFVLTRNSSFGAEGVYPVSCWEQVIKTLESNQSYPEEIMIAGGEEIYREFMPMCNRIYLTKLARSLIQYPGDSKFPEIPSDFKLVNQQPLQVKEWKLVCPNVEPNFPLNLEFLLYER